MRFVSLSASYGLIEVSQMRPILRGRARTGPTRAYGSPRRFRGPRYAFPVPADAGEPFYPMETEIRRMG